MIDKILIPMLAIGLIGAVLGGILSVADDVFHVEIDTRIEKVTEMLPGFNCGGCGFPGCSGLATALVEKELSDVKRCRPSNLQQRQQIADYLANTPGPDGETITVSV